MAKPIHSMIRVLNEARSVDFYRRAFGMKVADRFPFDGFTLVYLRSAEDDFELELTINHDRTVPYTHGDGYGHIAFVVADAAGEQVSLHTTMATTQFPEPTEGLGHPPNEHP